MTRCLKQEHALFGRKKKSKKTCDSSAVSMLGIGARLVPSWSKTSSLGFFFREELSLCATAALLTQPMCGTYGQSGDSLLSSDAATSVQKLVLTQPEVFVFVKNIININTAIITRY